MLYSFCRFLCAVFIKTFNRLEAKGLENIPKEGAFIVASNHVSFLDPVAVGVACPRPLDFIARADLFKGLFAWLLPKIGVVPIRRNSADTSALKEAMRRLRKGRALAIFPEGARAPEPEAAKPQAGIGFLAAKLQVPVIPAFVRGTSEALPKGAKFIRPTKISVLFGEQISIERRMPYQETTQLIMARINRLAC